jgi:carboxyl-terminal processing protease
LITRKEDKITEVYKDFPADKAGFKGDEIIQIGDVLLADLKMMLLTMKGAKNTKIQLKYIRQKKKYSRNILNEVEIKSVPFSQKIDAKTGYIVCLVSM